MNILLGVTGGIAAYKSASLINKLIKNGHNVRVIMTENAQKFITPLTLSVLSKNPVMTTMWEERDSVEHIEVTKWADILLVYPATANIIAKFANGIADDLLSTVFLAFSQKKVFICPAMNSNMYCSVMNVRNMRNLVEFHTFIGDTVSRVEILDPISGTLACGDVGIGKVVGVDAVTDRIDRYIKNEFKDEFGQFYA